ncbi:Inositol-1-monophosphatase [Rhynchospora pubera]|uniref:histidinol-phosphatase n=1 Tax=Rhynchospora pubera TaxID=906938 RepID=A0AAV8DTA8_9POAL|nr:Inositol-1-monophosphatase [Rhynchospora pubera]
MNKMHPSLSLSLRLNPTNYYYYSPSTNQSLLPLSSFNPNPNPTPTPTPTNPISISLSTRPRSILPILSSSSNSQMEMEMEMEIDSLVQVAHSVADVAGQVLRKYFRQRFDIIDKDDLSPVTIADREAEESMVSLIMANFPSHAIFGEENGWRCKEESPDFVWVLDPIDGTKSFITGKPLFGTLISILYKGKPIIGIIDQPILRERWLGIDGKITTLNGREITTRTCSALSQAYLYTTSPHLFSGEAEEAFVRVRNKVKVPLYGCDCYAYALLASGFVDLVVESGLKPYDFLALVPVIEGAGGTITDWKGNRLDWQVSPQSRPTSYNVVAAGDVNVHKEAIELLQ